MKSIRQKVLDHYDSSLSDDWHDHFDYYIYEETTADGYVVYVATYDQRNINVEEHVHYYEFNLEEEFSKAIIEGISIYTDDLDSDYINSAFENLYENLKNK
jgi:hypothetical protein